MCDACCAGEDARGNGTAALRTAAFLVAIEFRTASLETLADDNALFGFAIDELPGNSLRNMLVDDESSESGFLRIELVAEACAEN